MTTNLAGASPVDQPVMPLATRLAVLRVLLAERHPEHHAAVFEAERALEVESESRGMFVARLENMRANGDQWLTVAAVLALLNNCDMLAQRPNVEFSSVPAGHSSNHPAGGTSAGTQG